MCFHEDDERSRTDDSDEGTFGQKTSKGTGKGQVREVGQAVQDSSERVDGSGMDGMDGVNGMGWCNGNTGTKMVD